MRDYYSILGLRTTAKESEIKSAFRKLALRYHPDKNASPEAARLIVEINEAYEILGDPKKRTVYDQLISGQATFQPTQQQHRDPAYRKRAPNLNFKSKRQEMLEMMTSYHPITLLMSRVAFALFLFIALDFLLPSNTEQEVITKMTGIKTGRYQASNKKFFTNTGTGFEVTNEFSNQFTIGMPVEITYSSIVHVPIYLENKPSGIFLKVPTSIYGTFIFMPVILMITSALGSFYKRGIEFDFNIGITNCLLTIFTLLFLFIHKML